MAEHLLNYDEASDSLRIAFIPGAAGTGIELNQHVLLRIDKAARRAIGPIFFEYSVLAQQTELGPRSFPWVGLDALSAESRALALEILQQPPVNEYLTLSAYTPSMSETIPIASVRSVLSAAFGDSQEVE